MTYTETAAGILVVVGAGVVGGVLAGATIWWRLTRG